VQRAFTSGSTGALCLVASRGEERARAAWAADPERGSDGVKVDPPPRER
jgi:hypothetical protein